MHNGSCRDCGRAISMSRVTPRCTACVRARRNARKLGFHITKRVV